MGLLAQQSKTPQTANPTPSVLARGGRAIEPAEVPRKPQEPPVVVTPRPETPVTVNLREPVQSRVKEPTAVNRVIQALTQAKPLLKTQKALYGAEYSKRVTSRPTQR